MASREELSSKFVFPNHSAIKPSASVKKWVQLLTALPNILEIEATEES
jgi:hypothetical protein